MTQFTKSMNAVFWNAGARKMRFQAHLLAIMPDQTPIMPPNPISTRYIYFALDLRGKKDVQFFYPKKIVLMSSNLTGVPGEWD